VKSLLCYILHNGGSRLISPDAQTHILR